MEAAEAQARCVVLYAVAAPVYLRYDPAGFTNIFSGYRWFSRTAIKTRVQYCFADVQIPRVRWLLFQLSSSSRSIVHPGVVEAVASVEHPQKHRHASEVLCATKPGTKKYVFMRRTVFTAPMLGGCYGFRGWRKLKWDSLGVVVPIYLTCVPRVYVRG